MTIKDLAAQTGYSVGTISRVLNNQPNVSAKAKAAILQAAEACGFQLNANAQQLRQQHGKAVLVIVKGTSNELFASMVESIQALISQTAYPLIVDYMDEDHNEVQRAVQLCLEKKPLGILFLGGNSENFRQYFDKIQAPCVLVTNDASQLHFPNLSSVSSDDMLAAKTAVEHLIRLGHKKIAVIGGDKENSDTGRLRFQGCMAAFRQYGIEFDPEIDYEATRFSFADGYKAARRLLERKKDFTGLFAASDVMAIGAIRALNDAGKRVPEDISVVGFDGLDIGGYMTPRLSTIHQNVEEMARKSVQLLLDNIENKKGLRFITVPVTLKCRESVKMVE